VQSAAGAAQQVRQLAHGREHAAGGMASSPAGVTRAKPNPVMPAALAASTPLRLSAMTAQRGGLGAAGPRSVQEERRSSRHGGVAIYGKGPSESRMALRTSMH
jgi:hypothetical protein